MVARSHACAAILPILHWRPAAHLENLTQTALQRVGLAGDGRQKLFGLVLRHALAGSQLRSGPRGLARPAAFRAGPVLVPLLALILLSPLTILRLTLIAFPDGFC